MSRLVKRQKQEAFTRYVSLQNFNGFVFSYTQNIINKTGTLTAQTIPTNDTPARLLLHDTGRRLYPGAYPGVSTPMISVGFVGYTTGIVYSGFIDPLVPGYFQVFSTSHTVIDPIASDLAAPSGGTISYDTIDCTILNVSSGGQINAPSIFSQFVDASNLIALDNNSNIVVQVAATDIYRGNILIRSSNSGSIGESWHITGTNDNGVQFYDPGIGQNVISAVIGSLTIGDTSQTQVAKISVLSGGNIIIGESAIPATTTVNTFLQLSGAPSGTVVANSGTSVSVSETRVTSNSIVILQVITPVGGAAGGASVVSLSAGVGFSIANLHSMYGTGTPTDTSTYAYVVVDR